MGPAGAMRQRGLAVPVGERDPTCLPALVGSGLAAGWGGGLDLTISRTAILAEDVRILQITGVPPQWSGGEVSPRAGRTFPIREALDLGWRLSELLGWRGASRGAQKNLAKSLLGQ